MHPQVSQNGVAPGRAFGVPVLSDLGDLAGRRVLVRADLDAGDHDPSSPLARRRLELLLPTLGILVDKAAEVTVCGHAGDLDAKPDDAAFSFVCQQVTSAFPEVVVLPNLAGERERTGDKSLVAELVRGQDAFVNEAFQWCWLALASIVGPPGALPSAAGPRLMADLELLEPFLHAPPRPFVVVLGSDQSLSRLPGIRALILRADAVLLGGAMALPFLEAIGARPQQSTETELLAECRACFGLAREIRHGVHLPSDLVWEALDGSMTLAPSGALVDGSVSDIGPTTRLRFSEVLEGAASVLWVGALGRSEDSRFAAGTRSVASALPGRGHVVLGGDALIASLDDDILQAATGILSATDSAVALLKDGDLPGLIALRARSVRPAT